MPLVSVPAIYDGERIQLLERAPVQEPYRVLVTFVEPASATPGGAPNHERFWASFGAWQDDRSIEATLHDIHHARRSKLDPPQL